MTIHIERLERLATLLDRHAANPEGPGFDLSDWHIPRYRDQGVLWWKRRTECGTTACAVGLACLSGEFEPDGLGVCRFDDGLIPTFQGKDNWDAVQAFFGLNFDQASRLFSHSSYSVTTGPYAASAVSTRIRAMIKRSRAQSHKKGRTQATVDLIKTRALEPA